MERSNPELSPAMGKRLVREAHGNAGVGCWKKRRSGCNGLNTGLNVTRHESAPTSNESFFAREFGEL